MHISLGRRSPRDRRDRIHVARHLYGTWDDIGQFTGTENKISKCGSPFLRPVIYIAANIARINDPVFKIHYERLIARGKHAKQAHAEEAFSHLTKLDVHAMSESYIVLPGAIAGRANPFSIGVWKSETEAIK